MVAERSRVRVVVAEDHPLFRKALVDSIKARPDLMFAGEAADGLAALDLIGEVQPDVAVLDLRMPGLDGQQVLNALVRDNSPTRVLFLTSEVLATAVYEAIGAGAAGYMSKDADGDEICDAIAAVGRGETVIAGELQAGIAHEIRMRSVQERPLLSPRERQILVLTADGNSAPDIAEQLHLSAATVRTHLQHIYEKLGVSDRAAAVAEAMRRGLLE